MKKPDWRNILDTLLKATSAKQVREVLIALGDHADVNLDESFGEFGLRWHAFGDNPSNISSIGLGTKSGRSLTERLTNAQDALLEDRAAMGAALPSSPRLAAQQWFGRPISGPDDGLFKWNYAQYGYDRRISVVLQDSGSPTAPTVDVLDDGIGITPADFPGTILSLQKGNKISKWYVIGAFGQGGAATLAFAEYTLIVSRRAGTNTVAFTVIRVLNLSEKFKEDSYVYLVEETSDGFRIPSCDVEADALPIYDEKEVKAPALAKGTLVRHIGYKLPGLEKTLGPSPGNLYHYFHYTMFDPLLPFRVIDLRNAKSFKDELITGSRNRLMRLVVKKAKQEEEETGKTDIAHYRPMEFVVPHGVSDASIGIEYWVVLNYRKKGKEGEEVLRGQSNELFIQTGHPIIGTLNGQNQGELTNQILKEVGLSMVARHIVVHVDASNANSRIRRELFSTNREGFKEGDVLNSIVQHLRKMFEEDQELARIERELTENVAKKNVHETKAEVKKQVTKLLQEAGFKVKDIGETVLPGEGEKQPTPRKKRGKYKKFDPLPTLPYPQVTTFTIVYPKPKMEVHLNDHEVVLVETDADAEFDARGAIAIRSDPPLLEQAGKAPLRGGRIRWRLRPTENAEAGATGKMIVALTKPDGSQLQDATEYEILPALEEKTKKAKGQVPPFEIIPINPDDNPQEWAIAWPDLDDVEDEHERAAVAYRAITTPSSTIVYYSTVFGPFKEQLDKLKTGSPVILEFFRTNYEVWIAYHAILQESAPQEKTEDESLELVREHERARVAQMQVKQALKTAELMKKLQEEEAAGSGAGTS